MRKILLATAAGFAAMVADGATPARAQSAAEVSGQTPQPGLTGYVQGRYRFHMGLISHDGDSAPGEKLSSVDFFDYARIWVGADGVAANGLRYGARLEIRAENANVAVGDSRANLFYRRSVGYIGTPTLGTLRFGTGTVMAVEQMHVGHMHGGIATGLWDGDAPRMPAVDNPSTFWYSASTTNNRTAIGYFSPQFFGFDFGVSYSPNDGNYYDRGCSTTAANFNGCDRLSSSGAVAEAARLRNMFDAMIRHRGTFGSVGITASGGIRTAEPVSFSGVGAPNTAPFKRATAGIFGATVSFAGFTVGGNVHGGSFNRTFQRGATGATAAFANSLPKNGNNNNSLGWQLGASYTIGALSLGVAYHELRYEGSLSDSRNAKDKGLGIGASYALAPGLSLFAEYLWGSVRQPGVDLRTREAGLQDKVNTSMGIIGIGLAW